MAVPEKLQEVGVETVAVWFQAAAAGLEKNKVQIVEEGELQALGWAVAGKVKEGEELGRY